MAKLCIRNPCGHLKLRTANLIGNVPTFIFSSLFGACVKNSGLEMFFYHSRSQSVCAGKTLALCTSADFCQQSRPKALVPGDFEQNNQESGNPDRTTPVPSLLDKVTPVPSLFDGVTPVPGYPEKDTDNSDGRIQKTLLVGTRPPINRSTNDQVVS